jgi:putative ABC transport system permease protein
VLYGAQGQTRESVKMAFDTLRANKLRSGLDHPGHRHRRDSTVIAISSVISGLNNRVADFANSLGTNTFWVFHHARDRCTAHSRPSS